MFKMASIWTNLFFIPLKNVLISLCWAQNLTLNKYVSNNTLVYVVY